MTRQHCMYAGLFLAALTLLLAGVLRLDTDPILAVLLILGSMALLLYAVAGFWRKPWAQESELQTKNDGKYP